MSGRVQTDDPHRLTVYRWETGWHWWNMNTLSLPKCRELILFACALYDVAPPVVRLCGGEMSYSEPRRNLIALQSRSRRPGRGGMNPATALHEAAHHIVDRLFGEVVQDHGPTFLGVYLYLLWRAKVAPWPALTASARHHGLRWRVVLPKQL